MNTSPDDGVAAATIASNLARISARIAAAAHAAARDPASVLLVAVSKTHPASAVEAAYRAGQHRFGENRVQEALAKFPPLRERYPDLRLHLIGPLQTNKVRDAVRVADVIESLDRERVAEALARAADQEGHLPELLVQVNVGDEAQKSGVSRELAPAFVESCKRRFGAALRGVMAIPPVEGDPTPHFAWLAAFASACGVPVISMGMSNDFEAAIACGATEVRVGSAVFGARPPLALASANEMP